MRTFTDLVARAALAAGVSLLFAGLAGAAPITYVESVDGELAGQHIGVFDIGTNTVSGTESSSLTSFDRFRFTVAAGQQLDSILVSSISGSQGFTLAPAPWDGSVAQRYGFLIVNSTLVGTDVLPTLLTSDSGKTATAPLPAGEYEVLLGSVGTVAYTYAFDVSAANVPEPVSLALVAAGLAGIAARRRLTM